MPLYSYRLPSIPGAFCSSSPLTPYLTGPPGISQASLGPVIGVSGPHFANESAVSVCSAIHMSCTLLCSTIVISDCI